MTESELEMIAAQIRKAREKVSAAKSLSDAAHFDDSISRAYYSMFHAASALLLSEGITVESHQALKTMFGLRFVKTDRIEPKYGRWLSESKDHREQSDYDIFTDFGSADASTAIERAEAFLEEMIRYLAAQGVETS